MCRRYTYGIHMDIHVKSIIHAKVQKIAHVLYKAPCCEKYSPFNLSAVKSQITKLNGVKAIRASCELSRNTTGSGILKFIREKKGTVRMRQ